MPTILITALTKDQAAAERIQTALAELPSPAVLVPGEPEAAHDAVQTADVLLVVVGENWADRIADDPAVIAAVETGLHRRDSLVIPVLVDDAALPPAAHLPESLRALAYMSVAPVRSGDLFSLDIRRLEQQIVSHLRYVEAEDFSVHVTPEGVLPRQQTARSRGLPCNLLLIALVLVVGVVLLLATRLRSSESDGLAFDEATAPPLPSIAFDELLIGLAAGLGEETAARSESMLNGVQLALAERPTITINDSAFTVDLLVQDTRCSSLGGLQVAEVFASAPGVVGVIGDMCDISCRAAVPVYDEAGMTTISPGCTAPGLTMGGSSSFNRVAPSQAFTAVRAADYILDQLNVPRVSVIHDEQVVGRHLAETFAAHFTERGGELSGYHMVESRTLSIPALLEAVILDEPDLVYFAGRASNAAQLKQALVNEGSPELPFFLGDSTGRTDYASLVGEAGLYSYTVVLLEPSGGAVDVLAAQYEASYGAVPADPIFAYAYDATMLLLDAFEAVGTIDADGLPVIDRALLRDYVRRYSGAAVTGELRCDQSGDCMTPESAVLQWQNGEFQTVAP